MYHVLFSTILDPCPSGYVYTSEYYELYSYVPLQYYDKSSLEQCAHDCDDERDCKTFRYDEIHKTCKLFKETPKISLSKTYLYYMTCTRKFCGTFSNDEDYRLPAEKNSAYLSQLILGLGHETIEEFQTEVFEVAYTTLSQKFAGSGSCPKNETGLVTTFIIPGSEECTKDSLKTSTTTNIFLSVEDDCNFEKGKFNSLDNYSLSTCSSKRF